MFHAAKCANSFDLPFQSLIQNSFIDNKIPYSL